MQHKTNDKKEITIITSLPINSLVYRKIISESLDTHDNLSNLDVIWATDILVNPEDVSTVLFTLDTFKT